MGEFLEPDWRIPGVGWHDGRFYWWSARRVHWQLPDGKQTAHEFDDDLLWVYARIDGWIVVGETTVHLLSDGKQGLHLNASDVISQTVLNGDTLVVHQADGKKWTFDLKRRVAV